MRRRRPASAQAAAAALRPSTTPAAPEHAASGLSTCVMCHRDFVVPVQWEPVGQDRWWMFLRFAECGVSREVTVSNAEAERYDEELIAAARGIRRAADLLDRQRFAADVDRFVAAMRYGLIDAADFAR